MQLKNLFSKKQAQVQEAVLEPLALPVQETAEVEEQIRVPTLPLKEISPFLDELVDLDDRFFRLRSLIQQRLPSVRYSATKLRLYEVRGRFIEVEESLSDSKDSEAKLAEQRIILVAGLLSASAIAATLLLRIIGIA
jgi:hypothetical protein